MIEPYLTDIGLFFQLTVNDRERKFLIGFEALEHLGRHQGYTMNHLNLYRAHEALIHFVARNMAREEKSELVVVIETLHVAPPLVPYNDASLTFSAQTALT